MKRIISSFLTLVLVLGLCACGQKAPTWQEQYDLGVRYLEEGNYEEAIIAFTAAIEIDPKQALTYVGRADAYIGSGETEENLAAALADYKQAMEVDEGCAEAYLGMAHVYVCMGDYNLAWEILQLGLEKTNGNLDIEAALNELETKDISGMVDALYTEFLETQGYQEFISDWMYGRPNEYSIIDIDGDNIDELIISGGDSLGFYNFAVFGYDVASGKIYATAIPDSVIFDGGYNGNIAQYYGSLEYSSKYHALVYTELNNGSWFDSYNYSVLDDQELVVDFTLWFAQDYETQTISYGISDKTIGEEEYYSYIGECISLEWEKIPLSLPLSSKTDLREYIGFDIMEFIKIVDGMHDVGATDGNTEYSNGSIIASARYGSNGITFFSIDGDCDYSIYGIEYGMPIETATEIALQSCEYMTRDLPYSKQFVMADGITLSFHAEDEKTVDGISLFSD